MVLVPAALVGRRYFGPCARYKAGVAIIDVLAWVALRIDRHAPAGRRARVTPAP